MVVFKTQIIIINRPKTDPKIDPKIDPKTDPKTPSKHPLHWQCLNVNDKSIGNVGM